MPIPDNQIDCAEVTLLGVLSDTVIGPSNTANVFTYRRTAVAFAADKAALATAIDAAWVQGMMALQCTSWASARLSVRWLNDALDVPLVQVCNPLAAGQVATDSLPPMDAVTMLLRTALRGRNYRGSKRFPGIPEASTTRGVLSGGAIAAWQAVAASILVPVTDATGNTWNVSVCSRSLSQTATNPTTVVQNDVTAILTNLNIGSQDSRKRPTVR